MTRGGEEGGHDDLELRELQVLHWRGIRRVQSGRPAVPHLDVGLEHDEVDIGLSRGCCGCSAAEDKQPE